MSTLQVRRPNDYAGRWRRLWVEVDGHRVGGLYPKDELVVHLEPGRHRVVGRMDWTRSRTVEVDLPSNASEVAVQLSFPFAAILDVFVRPWRAVRGARLN